MKTENRNILRLLSLAGLTAFSTSLFAQDAAAEAAKPASITTEALFWVLLLVAVILMYVIYSMSEMIIWGVKRKMEQRKSGTGMLLLLAGTLLASSSASAQDAAATVVAAPAYNFWTDPYMPFYLLILVEVVVIAWMALVLFNMMRPERAAEPEVQRVSVLTAIWNKINPTLPVEREDEIKLDDHEYDGIVELGNKMPPWLQFIFYVTILFAVIYAPYYLLGYGKTMDEKYQNELAEAELARLERQKAGMSTVDENTVTLMQTSDVLSAGKETFLQFCAACHGNGGEGGVGPNLTDDYWLHGGSINNVFSTIKYGVPEKGMASWQDILVPKQISEVANYIKSLYGTNPPNQKEPQGDLWTDQPADTAAPDSTVVPVPADTMAVAVI